MALVALVGYLNHRFLRLPSTIGLVLIALMSSLLLLALDVIVPGWEIGPTLARYVIGLDFYTTLMVGMLAILLFAGALHMELGRLLARFVAVAVPIQVWSRIQEPLLEGTVPLLTWSGLRGGISVALVLSLPAFGGRDLLVTITYVVVLFRIVAQGLTARRVAARLLGQGAAQAADQAHGQ